MSLKNQVTPLGIDPGTVRLVEQRFKGVDIKYNRTGKEGKEEKFRRVQVTIGAVEEQ
jgi:hypothetical protein